MRQILAKRAAALKACGMLHKLGELTNDLRPRKKAATASDDEDEDDEDDGEVGKTSTFCFPG